MVADGTNRADEKLLGANNVKASSNGRNESAFGNCATRQLVAEVEDGAHEKMKT